MFKLSKLNMEFYVTRPRTINYCKLCLTICCTEVQVLVNTKLFNKSRHYINAHALYKNECLPGVSNRLTRYDLPRELGSTREIGVDLMLSPR